MRSSDSVRAWPPDRRVGHAGAGERRGRTGAQDRGAAWRGGERAAPDGGLDDVAVDGDPLAFRPRRQPRVVDAGRQLQHRARHSARQVDDEVPGGGVRGRVEHPPPAGGTPRRVAEDRVHAVERHFGGLGRGDADEVVQPECAHVGGGDRRGAGGRVDGVDAQTRAGEGDRVGAHAAAQVGHCRGTRLNQLRGQPRRPARRDRAASRLLQPGTGEEHHSGVRAELASGLAAQGGLGQGRCGECGIETPGPQGAGRAERVVAGQLGRLGQCHPSGLGAECGELIRVHPADYRPLG